MIEEAHCLKKDLWQAPALEARLAISNRTPTNAARATIAPSTSLTLPAAEKRQLTRDLEMVWHFAEGISLGDPVSESESNLSKLRKAIDSSLACANPQQMDASQHSVSHA
jgi:hypothetical protein